jgi:hypothetical protein
LTGATFVAFGGTAFFTAAFFTAAFFTAAFFTAAVFGALLVATADFAFAAAFAKRQRFFVAAMILLSPSGLILRFAFGASGAAGDDGFDSPRISAHRRRCASFIRLRVAALNVLRVPVELSKVAPERAVTAPSCACAVLPSTSRSAISARSIADCRRSRFSMMLLKPSAIV